MTFQEMKEILTLLIQQTEKDRQRAELLLEQTEKDRLKAEQDRLLRQEGMKKIEQDLGMRGDHAEEVIYRSIKKNLKAKGIEIYDVYRNLKSVRAEFDVVAVNGKQVIVVEVKNKLKQDHIDYFETRLPLFKKEFPEFAEYELLEGVAGLVVSDHIEKVTEKRGLFVFRQNGDHVEIVNSPNFTAKVF